MPVVEVSLSEELVSEFERMAEEQFVNRDEAVEELLAAGIDAYTTEFDEPTETDLSEEFAEDIWDTAEDPGATGEESDEYTF